MPAGTTIGAAMIDQFLTPNGKVASMELRERTTDWNTVNACLSEDEYGFRGRHFSGFAIDIGAHIGGVTIGLALDNPDLHVFAVEPVPPNAALLRANIERNGLTDRVTVLEGAAGGRKAVSVWYGFKGTELAEYHAYIGNNSTAYDNGGPLEHDEAVYPKPYTLASLVKMAGGHVSLLKIDCEGGEWAILDSKAIAAIDHLEGEWHPVRGKTQADLTALLAPRLVMFSGPDAGPGGFVSR